MVLSVADDVLGLLVKIPDSKGVLGKCQDATKGLAKRGKIQKRAIGLPKVLQLKILRGISVLTNEEMILGIARGAKLNCLGKNKLATI
ncbi:hypothetical protein GWN65_05000 [Candidatus Bathyarchaeota archaeon]|nr:hypothetical protein [Candidatus Bathyarchaeota archaeon]NIV44504.1 hypothetical protein [Candidatus Bathyarchaeota archaeon]